MSLIEVAIAISVITVGVVGIASGFAAVAQAANVAQRQAHLEAASRQVSDFVRASDLTRLSTDGLTYKLCAVPSDYQHALDADAALGLVARPAGVTWQIKRVTLSTSGRRNGVAVPPLQGCTSPMRCSPSSATCGDWGVQEITISTSSDSHTLQRTVWKTIGWHT